MSESFLHYLWQCQYFDKQNLLTTAGEEISILHPGTLNTNAGPDFFQAKININAVLWVGTVEIHVNSSDWYRHHHEQDAAYDTVILHVVWHDDQPIIHHGRVLPTLVLQPRVDLSLLQHYRQLVGSYATIACEKSLPRVQPLIVLNAIERAALQRLEKKANEIIAEVSSQGGDWEEVAYQRLAWNFGFKVNAEPFHQLSKAVSYTLLKKQTTLRQVEALLFGQAGMLPTKSKDEYITSLFDEYQYLAHKYSLHASQLTVAQWRFLRLRPANFPTLRIAQFASLVFQIKNLFASLIDADRLNVVLPAFQSAPSAYWQVHYRFGVKASAPVASMGKDSVNNILINTIAPLLVAYGRYQGDQPLIEQGAALLQHLEPETNIITRKWKDLGVLATNAFEAQGQIELYNHFCTPRKCLSCPIGGALLKPGS